MFTIEAEKLTPVQLPYKVICAWCGETIRLNANQDIEAMCLSCYHLMLFERTRTEPLAAGPDDVSER